MPLRNVPPLKVRRNVGAAYRRSRRRLSETAFSATLTLEPDAVPAIDSMVSVYVRSTNVAMSRALPGRNQDPTYNRVLGIGEGVAGVCFAVVALNADYWGCPRSGEVITRTPSSITVESCGTLNPVPWLIIGLILAIGAAVGYAIGRRPPTPH